MFQKILIANRGEIASRIIKTAKLMGIKTVAIYSTADEHSPYVQEACEAFCVGDAPAKDSYLNSDAIIKIARQSGVDAIHPGYGFLSENPEFAKACEKAGISFIGPSIAAMQAMASKQLAKQLLEKTNVPLIPGYHGLLQTEEHLFKEAQRIGFPVLLKAANGGGGKGMRTVDKADDFFAALAAAKRESLSSFADETMIIEKLLATPRHIEVQIMADNHGNIVHLFERDCSIQRRHQKIIEEAPAPHLSDSLREKLTKAACEAARSINYCSAGTVEFLVDNNEQFYFMEMNTRLQVEHPVTEMITGLDLVAWQIKIAANEPLPYKQEDIVCKGHALECRIYAEDPFQQFIPSIGELNFLKMPSGEGIRIDSGVKEHSFISQYYDPMIAKLITYGESRQLALQRMQQALDNFVVGGVKSNIPFLQAICAHPRFIKAQLSTNFLTEETLILSAVDSERALIMAAAFDYLNLFQQENDPLLQNNFAWQMHLPSAWYAYYIIEQHTQKIKIMPQGPHRVTIVHNDQQSTLKVHFDDDQLIVNDGKQIDKAWVKALPEALHFYFEKGHGVVNRFQWEQVSNVMAGATDELIAPMSAVIIAILKKPGELMKKGEPLIILEAMKMEHTLHAPKEGLLGELFYELNQQVHEGAKLLTINDLQEIG